MFRRNTRCIDGIQPDAKSVYFPCYFGIVTNEGEVRFHAVTSSLSLKRAVDLFVRHVSSEARLISKTSPEYPCTVTEYSCVV